MEPVVIVILIALVEYIVFGGMVGRARAVHGIKAPATTGNEAFERTFRAHQNTLENLVVFIPAVWIFGIYVSSTWAAALGVVYIIARALYVRGYVAAAQKRGPGAITSFVVNAVLVAGGIVGVIIGYL